MAWLASYLAQSIKDVIKIFEYLSLGDFGDVVHGFTGVIANSGILVREASQDWRHYDLQIPGQLLAAWEG
jgi:hypothetical protein